MKNLAFAVVALGMVACGNSPRVIDSGPITLPDSGPGHDAGPGTDTGPTSSGCGTLGTGTWPALPAGCLPRCTAATATAHDNCIMNAQYADGGVDQTAAGTCIDAAYAADTTPAASITDGTDTIMITCGGSQTTGAFGCEEWQQFAAIDMFCDSTLAPYLQCAAGVPAGGNVQTTCASQITALNGCTQGATTGPQIQNALNTLAAMCFAH